MHKENIFDLFNEQHKDDKKDPEPDNIVKAGDVDPEIVKPEEKPKEPEETPKDKGGEENA